MPTDPEYFEIAGLGWLRDVLPFLGPTVILIGALLTWGIAILPEIAKARANHIIERDMKIDGLARPIWRKTEMQLVDDGYRRRPLDNGYVLLEKPRDKDAEHLPLLQTVVRKGKRTVAVADIVALDDQVSWGLNSSKIMSDDRTLDEIIAESSIPQWLVKQTEEELSVIAVGLVSRPVSPIGPTKYVGKHYDETHTDLGKERATNLINKFIATVEFLKPSRPVKYWTVNLGIATAPAPRYDYTEVRQRAAIVVAISSRKTGKNALSANEALALITTNVKLYGTDLTDYANSRNPKAEPVVR